MAAPAGVTVAVGIGFANPKVGYFAGGANGAGTEILKTEDGGESWNVIPGINFVSCSSVFPPLLHPPPLKLSLHIEPSRVRRPNADSGSTTGACAQ